MRSLLPALLLAGGCAAGAPRAVVFLGSDCPVSNFYAPELERLAGAFPGVAFEGVYPEPALTDDAARRHAAQYGLRFPVKADPDQSVAARHRVGRVPTVLVLAPDGAEAYRGRVDDRYSPEGKRRDEPRTRDLEEALRAVAAGRRPDVTETPVYGCPLLRKEAAR